MDYERSRNDDDWQLRQVEEGASCSIGCAAHVPKALNDEGCCVAHYSLRVEQTCADLRRETARSGASSARRREITGYVTDAAVKLASAAGSSTSLSDETKRRVLATFLTLMNLRENLDRAEVRFEKQPELVAC